MSWIGSTADSLVTAIEALNLGVIVSTSWVPDEIDTSQELRSPAILVFVDTRSTKLIARGHKAQTITAWVSIVDPLKQEFESEQASEGQGRVDAIIDGLLGNKVGTLTCTGIEQTVTTSVQHWKEYRQFASFLKLTIES